LCTTTLRTINTKPFWDSTLASLWRTGMENSSSKRKVIVSNIMSLDGFYEGKKNSIDSMFEYFHEDYNGDQNLDLYMAERMRACDLLVLNGRRSFLGNMAYWESVPNDPNATEVRREIAQLQKSLP